MDVVAGLVLAGGTSRRFGSDKAVAVVDGVTLLDRAVACLREACDGPVLVASGDGTSRPGVADGQVADLVQGAGPLSAIGAGLQQLGRVDEVEAVAVLAVDHVAPSAALLQVLASLRGEAVCAVVEVEGRLQPLHAVWSVAAADAVAAAVAAGERSVLRWLEAREDVRVPDPAELAAAGVHASGVARAVRDADTPDDLDHPS